MKKKRGKRISFYEILNKELIKIMKLSLLLTLVGVLQINAAIFSQGSMYDISYSDMELRDVFIELENETEYRFFYSENLLDLKKKVDIDIKKGSIEEIVNYLLTDVPLTYRIFEKNLVVITSKETLDQEITIKGKITDVDGTPLPGVNVVEKGTANGAVTNLDGEYVISVTNPNAILSFSYVGFLSEDIDIGGKTVIDITLVEDIQALEEIVVVGYGEQKKVNLTGSVAAVQSEDLVVAPIANATNTLAGRLPGLISMQSSGQPGADDATLSIRGFGEPLVIVDGIETEFKYLDPSQIESISILKDASASIYGARAGNGVILVTTKRGNDSKPILTFNLSNTFQGITTMPKPCNAGQYTELEREKHIYGGNPESTAPYTSEQIQKYYDGNDPSFPDTDWFSELVRDWSPMQHYNLSVRGGSDKIKYYGFLGYMNQETNIKHNGGGYKRYNFQSNIDAKILDNLTLQLTISNIVEDRNYPHKPISSGENSFWGFLWNTLPIYPSELPDKTKIPFAFGAGTGGAHVISNREIAGYNDTDSQDKKGTIVLNYDFNSIKGLSAKLFANYSNYNSAYKAFSRSVDFYTYNPENKEYTLVGSFNSSPELTQQHEKGRTITGQFSLFYDRKLGNHHVSALALYEAIDEKSDYFSALRQGFLSNALDQLYAGSTATMSNDGKAYESGRISCVTRINYAYKDKYLLESTFRADASDRFPKNSRWGYFPGINLAWRIAEENFMQSLSSIDDLKLRLSYGVSGSDKDAGSVYRYLSGYSPASKSYIIGSEAQTAIAPIGLANNEITWETLKIYNLGINYSFFNRKLYGETDVFYRERSGILGTRATSIPTSFGANLPLENLNSQNNRGIDIMIGTAGGLMKEFSWDISANVSWSRAKWNHYDEPEYTDMDQIRIYKLSGNWTDREFGYISDGLFTSQSEIDALTYTYPSGNSSLRPGDVRIVDVNNDGIIDWKDEVEIGNGTMPHWMIGLNTNLKYRNFDLSALLQGAFGHYTKITYHHSENYPLFVYQERWSETTNNNKDALVPRLGGTTFDYFVDNRLKKAGYVRLKILSVGYTFPDKWLNVVKIANLRLYVAGTNLLTFDKLKKYNIDPESLSGETGRYYPQQKTISFGANVSF